MYLTEIICDLLGCINLGRQHYCCWLHTRLLYPGERSGLMWNQLPLSKATSLYARELRISSTKTLFPTLHKSLFCICLALISLRSAQPMGLPPALEVERNKYCSWPVDYAIKLLDISEKRGNGKTSLPRLLNWGPLLNSYLVLESNEYGGRRAI